MKRFLFFFLILFTWYMAAMYRLQSLMALAVAEIILLFLLFFLTRYLKKKFDCRILREQSDIEKRGKDGNKNLDRKFLCFSGGKIQTGVYPGLQKK